MAKTHKKPTNLRLVAVTSKRHTKPAGIGMTIPLPHELAVKWAEKGAKILMDLAREIADDHAAFTVLEANQKTPKAESAPEPQPVQEIESNANLAQS